LPSHVFIHSLYYRSRVCSYGLHAPLFCSLTHICYTFMYKAFEMPTSPVVPLDYKIYSDYSDIRYLCAVEQRYESDALGEDPI
jgi:hypothetical protein